MQINKKFTNILFIIILSTCSIVKCADILVVLPTLVPSHVRIFKFLIKALSDEHKITFYGVPLNLNNINVTEKGLNMDMDAYLEDFSSNIFKTTCKKSGIEVLMNEVLWLNYDFFNQMFTGKDIQDLINSNNTFDLMITVAHTAEMFFPLSHKFNIPLIQIATSVPFPWSNDIIGNPNFYASDMSFITYEMPTNLLQRIIKFVKHSIIVTHYQWRFLPFLNKIAMQHFPPDTPSLEKIAKRTSLLFMNYESKLGYARPNVPSAIEIGGLHCNPAKPLPPDLEEFMQSSGRYGVIYFSLGSTLRGTALPEEVRRAILKVFSKMAQKILWKWEGSMADLPPNVKISKWVPQQDILGHNKLRLFITQGGMLSTQEAAYHGVPVLMMPLLLDQYTNAAVVEQNGYGLQIDYCKFSETEFFEKITKILQDPRYNQRTKELSFSLKDTPWKSEEKIKWWIRYVLKHKNTSNLRPAKYNTYSEIDVYLALLLLVLIILYSLRLTIKKIKSIWYISAKKIKTQ